MKRFGVLLDCSRNAVMKPEEVKKLILFLEKAGYNCLELYTEDTYELEGEPRFGYLRGRYTKAELKELDAFGKEHGVELIPCIETLGHLEKIFEWKEYAGICDCGGVLLAGEEKSYRLIEKMFAACAECFSSRTINIGMDEAHGLGLGQYLFRHGYEDRFGIFLGHLKRVSEIALKYGFTPVIWSDMFFRIAFGGEYVCEEGEIPAEIAEKVPENVQLAYWDYFSFRESTYTNMLQKHRAFHRPVWFAGSAVKCCGFHSANDVSLDRLGKSIRACLKEGVDNILITLWGDGGNESPAAAVLPSLVYASECVKGNFDVGNAARKFREIFGEKWEDFLLCDLSETSLPREDDIGTGAKEMLYSDYFCGRMHEYISDSGEERAAFSRYAEKFDEAAAESGGYKEMFRFYGDLCRALAVKYDLGRRTRKFYRAGDTAALRALLPEYDEAEKRLEKLLRSFEEMWFRFNKPHGFEVHEMRIGGVIARTKSCRRRLAAYLAGGERIPELEEDFLPPPEGCPEGCRPYSNMYGRIATVNSI